MDTDSDLCRQFAFDDWRKCIRACLRAEGHLKALYFTLEHAYAKFWFSYL